MRKVGALLVAIVLVLAACSSDDSIDTAESLVADENEASENEGDQNVLDFETVVLETELLPGVSYTSPILGSPITFSVPLRTKVESMESGRLALALPGASEFDALLVVLPSGVVVPGERGEEIGALLAPFPGDFGKWLEDSGRLEVLGSGRQEDISFWDVATASDFEEADECNLGGRCTQVVTFGPRDQSVAISDGPDLQFRIYIARPAGGEPVLIFRQSSTESADDLDQLAVHILSGLCWCGPESAEDKQAETTPGAAPLESVSFEQQLPPGEYQIELGSATIFLKAPEGYERGAPAVPLPGEGFFFGLSDQGRGVGVLFGLTAQLVDPDQTNQSPDRSNVAVSGELSMSEWLASTTALTGSSGEMVIGGEDVTWWDLEAADDLNDSNSYLCFEGESGLSDEEENARCVGVLEGDAGGDFVQRGDAYRLYFFESSDLVFRVSSAPQDRAEVLDAAEGLFDLMTVEMSGSRRNTNNESDSSGEFERYLAAAAAIPSEPDLAQFCELPFAPVPEDYPSTPEESETYYTDQVEASESILRSAPVDIRTAVEWQHAGLVRLAALIEEAGWDETKVAEKAYVLSSEEGMHFEDLLMYLDTACA